MVPDALIREAWLMSEAVCGCRKQKHGHPGCCNQFLIWENRGGTGQGAWEARLLNDPRRPACEILCAACYAKATGRVPMGGDRPSVQSHRSGGRSGQVE
jgi:hypothetical protein